MIKTASKTNLFFLELTIMLFILSLSMAVCVQVFFQAQTTADYGRNLSTASVKAQSAAACYKSFAGDMVETAEFLGAVFEDGKIASYYDKEWRESASEQGAFKLSISKEDRLARIQVIKLADQSRLFSIDVKAVEYE